MNRAALAAALAIAGCAGSSDVDVFNDAAKPYADRLDALLALRASGDPRAYEAVRPAVEDEAARGTGISVLSDLEARGCAEALLWQAERGGASDFLPELYLSQRRLPERVRVAAARALRFHPTSTTAKGALWAALGSAKEGDAVRSASLESLRAFHPEDLAERVGALPSADDPWLAGLKARLK
jgi:hypothetical protein